MAAWRQLSQNVCPQLVATIPLPAAFISDTVHLQTPHDTLSCGVGAVGAIGASQTARERGSASKGGGAGRARASPAAGEGGGVEDSPESVAQWVKTV